jgi:hypothetical protein
VKEVFKLSAVGGPWEPAGFATHDRPIVAHRVRLYVSSAGPAAQRRVSSNRLAGASQAPLEQRSSGGTAENMVPLPPPTSW